MRNKKVSTTLFSVLTAILMVFVISTTVFATDEVEQVTEEQPQVVETAGNVEEETQTPQAEVTQPPQHQPETQAQPEPEQETEEQTEKVTPTYYDVYGDDLPEVESQEVTAPTTVELPDVEVSDTSLLFGVIAWLCVAVGIAVIAGVLVSQRARQSGANSNSRDTRRK